MKWDDLEGSDGWTRGECKLDNHPILGLLIDTHRYENDLIEYDHFVGLDQSLEELVFQIQDVTR